MACLNDKLTLYSSFRFRLRTV